MDLDVWLLADFFMKIEPKIRRWVKDSHGLWGKARARDYDRTYHADKSLTKAILPLLGVSTSFSRLSFLGTLRNLCWINVFAALLLHVRISIFARKFGKWMHSLPSRQMARKRKAAHRRNMMTQEFIVCSGLQGCHNQKRKNDDTGIHYMFRLK